MYFKKNRLCISKGIFKMPMHIIDLDGEGKSQNILLGDLYYLYLLPLRVCKHVCIIMWFKGHRSNHEILFKLMAMLLILKKALHSMLQMIVKQKFSYSLLLAMLTGIDH